MSLSPLKLRKQITAAALVKDISAPEGWIYTATPAPDGSALLLGTSGALHRVDLLAGTTRQVIVDAADRDAVSDIAFTPDGSRLVATCWSGCVAVLDWPTLRPLVTHSVATDRLHALAIMPDGRSAWVGGHDQKRTRIDLETGAVLASQHGEWGWLSAAAVSDDGSTLVTGDAATVVRLCDAITGVERKALKLGIAHNLEMAGEEVLIPSLRLATVNVTSGRVVKRFEGEHKLGATAAVFVDDGALVVSVAQHDALMVIWDRKTGEPLLTMKPLKKGGFASVVIAGDHLVTVPYCDQPLSVWRTGVLARAARG